MAFREVRVFEVREVLRLWMRGESLRAVERLAGVDRKTVRRYVEAATGSGWSARAGRASSTRPDRLGGGGGAPPPHRRPRRAVAGAGGQPRPDQGLARRRSDRGQGARPARPARGWSCPSGRCTATPGRCSAIGRGRGPTVRVADGAPGRRVPGRLRAHGPLFDPATERTRAAHALIFTACVSRHCFVWVSFTQTTAGRHRGLRGGLGVLRRRVPPP